jgi:hypothetical protein
MFGAADVCTPFRYEINYRNFFLLTQGSAQIKMAPPQSIKYLYPNYDYENFEFKSPVDPWNPQAQYKADFDKMKCLEFTLLPGKTVFIPAFWWYSIKLNKDACISCFRYRTYMNNLAMLPYFGMYALQIQNVKRETVPLFPLLKKVMRSEEQNQPLGTQVLETQILEPVIKNDEQLKEQKEEQNKDNDTTPIDLLSPTM